MSEEKCPLCGNDCAKSYLENVNRIDCNNNNCYTFLIQVALTCGATEIEIRKRYSMIYDFLARYGGKKPYYTFYYEQSNQSGIDDPMYINVSELMKNYPKNVGEKLNRILLNLAKKYPNIGDDFRFEELPHSLLFLETEQHTERDTLLEYMNEATFFKVKNEGSYHRCKLTTKAWERVYELTNKQNEINQGFIAMSFRDETKNISDCFKFAINECGYADKRIDEKEYNGQIVPEIFFEIGQSKFVVVDVTYPNYGAYYEAGYAQALGKEVIICCRKVEFDDMKTKPHFDISQKNMIVWVDEDDLKKRLKNRIEATVGK